MQSITCFLIDDDPDDQDIFSMSMQDVHPSIRCIFANNAPDALKKINDDPGFSPDFIFLDLNLPRMSGRQLITELKKIPRIKQVPVIIYSTSIDHRDEEEMIKLGAAQFLTKPTELIKLTNALKQILLTDKSAPGQPYGKGKKGTS
jgi:CheY-like chemotaxis protein